MAFGQNFAQQKAANAAAAGAAKPKPKVNLLGQPIVAQQATPAVVAASPAPKALSLGTGGAAGVIARQNAALSADSPESPRSKAAKLMKRQAGIGQLKTMHVEDTL